ncbi:MAG: ATP-dependent dethiobiotin synthetase BioD [Acidimicrobiia bacterium]
MTARPARLVVVTGTGTEVGKTWVAAAALQALRARNVNVAARKPVQSFEPGSGSTDAEVLAAATGETPEAVCLAHRSYAVAMAPPMAAEKLGVPPFTIADLVAELSWPAGIDVGLVEGAGGPLSPLTADGDNVDLCVELAPDVVVLVADAGLGTLNAVRLCADALDPHPLVVFLNRYDRSNELHRANSAWLTDRDGFDVVTSIDELASAS